MLLDLVDGFACNTAVQGYKVNSVLSVQTDNINEILCRKCGKVTLIMNYAVINGNCSDHCRTLRRKLAAERLCVAVGREIHYRLCAHIDRSHNLFHFNVVILAVTGNAEVDIDLRAEH